jgi:acyl-CoA thioesterase-1
MPRSVLRLAAALVLVAGSAGAGDSPARGGLAAGCAAPPELLTIEPALTHFAARMERGEPLIIVAVGSSSTQGVGASDPALSYPSRLEAELRQRFPDIAVRVINRGKGGEEAPQMIARIERDVIAEHPDLVIWQLGTNAVLRHEDVADEEDIIERGLARLKESGSDVVLMDMQYAPRVIARSTYPAMERLLANLAKRERVGLFRRFALMRYWHSAAQPDAPTTMIGSDGLHMTDRGYGCLAADLAEALARNWRSYQAMAQRGAAASLAGVAAARHPAAAPEVGAP